MITLEYQVSRLVLVPKKIIKEDGTLKEDEPGELTDSSSTGGGGGSVNPPNKSAAVSHPSQPNPQSNNKPPTADTSLFPVAYPSSSVSEGSSVLFPYKRYLSGSSGPARLVPVLCAPLFSFSMSRTSVVFIGYCFHFRNFCVGPIFM